ncbi:hypothetical protein IJI17_01230 [Candidatus Saccharibacteria bacterium]|nr:hypothetical protein [Candidatus Saccharibacteria bacterium]
MKQLETSLFSPAELVDELMAESRSLGLPEKSVPPIIERVLNAVTCWLTDREIITRSDLERVVFGELAKYSPDLAFVYRNRDKII